MTESEAASIFGRMGGRVKSARKAAAARKNGKLGGRPKSTKKQANPRKTLAPA